MLETVDLQAVVVQVSINLVVLVAAFTYFGVT